MNKLIKLTIIGLTAISCLAGTYSPPSSSVSGNLDWPTNGVSDKILTLQKYNLPYALTKVTLVTSSSISNYFYLENLDSFQSYDVKIKATNELSVFNYSNGTIGSLTDSLLFLWETNQIVQPREVKEFSFYNSQASAVEFTGDLSYFIGNDVIQYIAGTTSYRDGQYPDNYNGQYVSFGEVSIFIIYEYTTPCVGVGTATIGYWKNHCSQWPVNILKIGCCSYNKNELINFLNCRTSDPIRLLIKQLIAAKLTILDDSCNQHSCIDSEIKRADELICKWLNKYCIPNYVKTEILSIKDKLDSYNNGLLCEKHRN